MFDGWRCWKGKNWMVQVSSWAGPFNFGIHISLLHTDIKYVDFHLPYMVITIGQVDKVEYPPDWWGCSKDYRSEVEYWRR